MSVPVQCHMVPITVESCLLMPPFGETGAMGLGLDESVCLSISQSINRSVAIDLELEDLSAVKLSCNEGAGEVKVWS